MFRGDTTADKIYDRLRADFGGASPKAFGYLSKYSFLLEQDLVLDAIGDVSGTVVDLACGAGFVTLPLVRTGARVIGVDFNEAACRQAGRNGLLPARGNTFSLPLANTVADVVVNVKFAQQYHPKAVEGMLHETARVLRPSGRLVLVWSNRAALTHRAASVVLYILKRLHGLTGFRLIGHAPVDIRAAGERTGLTLDTMYAIFPPLRLRLRMVDGPLVGLIGSSFVAVFRFREQA